MSDPVVDATVPAFSRDPFPTYAGLRVRGPVGRVVLANGREAWFVTGHAEARKVLADKPFTAVRPTSLDLTSPRGLLERHMLNTDAPEHTRLRRIAATAFTDARIDELGTRIERIVDALLDTFPHEGVVDLVTAYGFPLPVQVMCEVLGVPEADREGLRQWTYVVGSRRSGHRRRVEAAARVLHRAHRVEAPHADRRPLQRPGARARRRGRAHRAGAARDGVPAALRGL